MTHVKEVYPDGVCILCKKIIPKPLMVCFYCSSKRTSEVIKAVEKMALKIYKGELRTE